MVLCTGAELGSLGLEPSHFNFVPSSDGSGRKIHELNYNQLKVKHVIEQRLKVVLRVFSVMSSRY
ncbi:CLUMA_CG002061, isoform A [Clunio marinus]|uniref:CLUMA_CG002061, isoform A n=1 Tax=Clunio marinus TaxID=568069 RepID=A0A1J1HL69_9DIPT|nr:CLUMA_CG002061, isoform A [Clunio marinus]